MTTKKLTKLIALYLPYILLGLVATNLGEACSKWFTSTSCVCVL